MKTNFLYFKENGKQTFIATAGQTDFTINGDSNWDVDVTADTHVRVTVTDVSAGTTSVIADNAKSFASNVITLAAQGVGDIVVIELIPGGIGDTEACFRADRLLSVHQNSNTVTEITFDAANCADADDVVLLTHPSDATGATTKRIAEYIYEACNANKLKGGDVITVWDKQNGVVGKGLDGVTKMLISVA